MARVGSAATLGRACALLFVLLAATARRGQRVDPATRERLIEAERRRAAAWQAK